MDMILYYYDLNSRSKNIPLEDLSSQNFNVASLVWDVFDTVIYRNNGYNFYLKNRGGPALNIEISVKLNKPFKINTRYDLAKK
jgi:hypothetical protein